MGRTGWTLVALICAPLSALWALQVQNNPEATVANAAKAPAAAGGLSAEEAAEMQRAREWMVAQRIARDKLTPERGFELERQYAKLTPPQMRVLISVFEQSYDISFPYTRPEGDTQDPLEATREWLVAFRIVRDRLTPAQAKQFGAELRAMTPSQIRILRDAYWQQAELAQAQRTTQAANTETPPNSGGNPESLNPPATVQPPSARQPTGPTEEDLRNMRAAQERMATQDRMDVEQMRRQMGLQQAQHVRQKVDSNVNFANNAANVAAQYGNARFEQQQEFSQAMYARGISSNNWTRNGPYVRYWGW